MQPAASERERAFAPRSGERPASPALGEALPSFEHPQLTIQRPLERAAGSTDSGHSAAAARAGGPVSSLGRGGEAHGAAAAGTSGVGAFLAEPLPLPQGRPSLRGAQQQGQARGVLGPQGCARPGQAPPPATPPLRPPPPPQPAPASGSPEAPGLGPFPTAAQTGSGGACIFVCVWLDEDIMCYGDVGLPLDTVACLLGPHTAQHGLPPPGLPLRPARARGDPRPPPGPLPGAWLRSRPGRTSPAGAGPVWQLVGLWEWLRRSGAASGDMLVLEAGEAGAAEERGAAAACLAGRRVTGVSLRLLKPFGEEAAMDAHPRSAKAQAPTASAAAAAHTHAPAADARTIPHALSPRRSGGSGQLGAGTAGHSGGAASGGAGSGLHGGVLPVLDARAVEAGGGLGTAAPGPAAAAATADAGGLGGGGPDTHRSGGADPAAGVAPAPGLSAASVLRAVGLGGAAERGSTIKEAQQAPRMPQQAVHAAARTSPGVCNAAADAAAAGLSQGRVGALGSGDEGLGTGAGSSPQTAAAAAAPQQRGAKASLVGTARCGDVGDSRARTVLALAQAVGPGGAPDGGGGTSRKRGRDTLEGSGHVEGTVAAAGEAVGMAEPAAHRTLRSGSQSARLGLAVQGGRGCQGGPTGPPSKRRVARSATAQPKAPMAPHLTSTGSGSGSDSDSASETESSAYEPSASTPSTTSASPASLGGDLVDEPPAEQQEAQGGPRRPNEAQGRSAAAVPGADAREASAAAAAGDGVRSMAGPGAPAGTAAHISREGEDPAADAPATVAAYDLKYHRGTLRCHLASMQHAFPAELLALQTQLTSQPLRLYGRIHDGGLRLYDCCRLGGAYGTTTNMHITGCVALLSGAAGGKDRVASTTFRLAVLEDGRAVVEAGEATEPEPRILRASAFGRSALVAVPSETLLSVMGLTPERLAGLRGHLQLRVRASVAGSPGAEELQGVCLFPPTGKGSWTLRGLCPWLLRSGAAVGDLLALGRAEEPPPAAGAGSGAGPSTAAPAAGRPSVPAITVRLLQPAGVPATVQQWAAGASSPGRVTALTGGGGSAGRKRGREAAGGGGLAQGSLEEVDEGAEVQVSQPARGTAGGGRGTGQSATYSGPSSSPAPDCSNFLIGDGPTLRDLPPAAAAGNRGSVTDEAAGGDGDMAGGQDSDNPGLPTSPTHAAQLLTAEGTAAEQGPRSAPVVPQVPPGPSDKLPAASCAGLPAASITRLQGYAPPGELPPLRPGELRLCGLTFHPAVAPAVRAALEQWEAAQPGAADPAADPVALQTVPEEAPGLDPLALRTSLSDLLGLTAPAGAAAGPLPEGPVACGLVAPCGDPAQGRSELQATACIAAGSAVCVVGGYVLPRGAAEELVASGLSQCRPEVRAQVAAALEGAGGDSSEGAFVQAAWRLTVSSLMLPYDLPYDKDTGGTDGAPQAHPGPLRLSQLGYGGVGSLVENCRAEPMGDGAGVTSTPVHTSEPNCQILSVSVRGVCLPVLVALRDIAPGERLLRDYGEGWWRDMDAAWGVAAINDATTHQQALP
ncbi:hypothetical protein HYH03_012099 [Edaphochlamys debaryana]|uniref:SET domain-containing protein n=1 Tax=Edaphochlamys debaryana TaxID=47281 RepID=A0A836BVV8_9CHLO|nr:hypothetical protein HYH03_012099 [Edaphochlamys debaryana]|eukprot:KAG2489463.1 hypothetical protein HYH03_012099 [Edaphochlamys debaryana]